MMTLGNQRATLKIVLSFYLSIRVVRVLCDIFYSWVYFIFERCTFSYHGNLCAYVTGPFGKVFHMYIPSRELGGGQLLGLHYLSLCAALHTCCTTC